MNLNYPKLIILDKSLKNSLRSKLKSLIKMCYRLARYISGKYF